MVMPGRVRTGQFENTMCWGVIVHAGVVAEENAAPLLKVMSDGRKARSLRDHGISHVEPLWAQDSVLKAHVECLSPPKSARRRLWVSDLYNHTSRREGFDRS